MKRLFASLIFILTFMLLACNANNEKPAVNETEQIAEEAYIFAYPMIEHYKMMFAMAMYKESGAYQAPFNVLVNNTHLNGPKDTIIVRPNNDTFYSAVWFNLTNQPQVLTVPKITDDRYYSFQIIDIYTHNIDYIGSRKTGSDAGSYMFVGPNWNGETPEGINKVIKSEGNFLLALGRTQVFGQDDIESAQAVMQKYKVESLDKFLGKVTEDEELAPPALPMFNPKNISNANFINYFNALMAEAYIHPDEKALFEKFEKIGIEPGKPFNADSCDAELVQAINSGIESAMNKIKAASMKLGERKNGWQLIAGIFGTREAMKGKYLTRAAAAYFGLWGNDLEEAFYPETTYDAEGNELDGSQHNYLLHFNADELPPVKAFWSMTMYKLPAQLLIENEINRYVIGSATNGLKYNDDGSLDIYIQKDNPGKEKESNWLPAYDGKFSLQSRMYWPKPEALNPLYAPPAVIKVD